MSRTSPFFMPQKEVDFINAVNEELIDELVGQSVDIYKISVDQTDENIYGESTTKVYDIGFRVNCLIDFVEPTTDLDEFGSDYNANIELYFQRANLASGSLDFYPEIGDIVDWNDHYWEVNGVTEPQLLHGHPGYSHTIKTTAHRSRLSSLQIEERPK
jgi:flagellar basal body rod protein FlgC